MATKARLATWLLVLLAAGTTAGFVSIAASHAPAAAPPVPVWHLPPAEPGDVAIYRDATRTASAHSFRFTSHQQLLAWDGNVSPVEWVAFPAQALTNGAPELSGPYEFAFAEASMTSSAVRSRTVSGARQEVAGVRLDDWQVRSDLVVGSNPKALDAWPPCGARHALQGSSVELNGSIHFSGPCEILGMRFPGWVLRTEPGDPAATQRWLSARVVDDRGRTHGLRVLVDVAKPFPAQIQIQPDGFGARLDLALEWTRYAYDGPARAVQPVGIRMSAWTPSGPSEVDIRHPFPLSQAFRDALQHPMDRTLTDFRRAHPDAYLRAAQYEMIQRGATVEHRWWLELTDGLERARQCVVRSNLTSPFEASCPGSRTWREEAPASPPDQAPTVAAIWDLWRGLRSPRFLDSAPNAWGFDVECEDTECQTSRVEVHGGIHVTRDATTGPNLTQSRLTWSSDGNLRLQERYAVDDEAPVAAPQGRAPSPAGSVIVLAGAPAPQPAATPALWTIGLPLLIGLGWGLRRILGHAWTLILAARLEPGEAVQHPVRARLVALIEARPGIHSQEIQRELGISHTQARHHLEVLRRCGVISLIASDGFQCFFRAGAIDRRVMASAQVLKSTVARRVLQMLRQDGSPSLTALARRAHVSVATIHYHVHRLRDRGLVQAERRGGRDIVRITELGVAASQLWPELPLSKNPTKRP